MTRRSASRGDLLKNFGGVMLGGKVVGFLFTPVLLLLFISHARIEPWWSLSKCSVEAVVRVCLCFGYHPLAGRPWWILINSPFAWRAWLILRCDRPPVLPSVVHPTKVFFRIVLRLIITKYLYPLPLPHSFSSSLPSLSLLYPLLETPSQNKTHKEKREREEEEIL